MKILARHSKHFMKLLLTILLTQWLLSCNNTSPKFLQPNKDSDSIDYKNHSANEKIAVLPKTLLKDFTTWYHYTSNNIHLSQNFIPLDTDSFKIDKATFLKKLMTGKVVAFNTSISQGIPVYQLYALHSTNKDIQSVIQQLAAIEMKNFKMEGRQLPEFSFTDLNVKNYNTASSRGKILVLKCWFIHCVACVREFPECNQLVDDYKGRNDVLFISLASDTKNELKTFLATQPFNYAVIPQMDNYMANQLEINMYPTHLLIGRDGKIVKVVNSIKELAPFLKAEIAKHLK